MPSWVNHVTIAAPRNGTTTHTVSPSSGTVVAGALFTPTAGNLLVLSVEGSVTSSTPSGWTLGQSAVNNTGLYVWYRTAAGGDSITTTHNGSNYPLAFDWYEFPAGSAWVSAVSAVNVASGGAGPSLSGLTGSNFVGYTVGEGATTAARTVTWSVGTTAVTTTVVNSGTDGYTYSLAYSDPFTGSSASSAATVTGGSSVTLERLVFAVKPATATPAATGTAAIAWTATSTATGTKPAVPINTGTAATAWIATASATGNAPAVAPATGTAADTWSAAATASGSVPAVPPATGTGAESWTANATAAGTSPAVPANTGQAAESWMATATATGTAPVVALAAGTATSNWAAVATATGTGLAPILRDIKILSTTVPVSAWSTNGITSGWMTGPIAGAPLTTTGPKSGWSTTSPQN